MTPNEEFLFNALKEQYFLNANRDLKDMGYKGYFWDPYKPELLKSLDKDYQEIIKYMFISLPHLAEAHIEWSRKHNTTKVLLRADRELKTTSDAQDLVIYCMDTKKGKLTMDHVFLGYLSSHASEMFANGAVVLLPGKLDLKALFEQFGLVWSGGPSDPYSGDGEDVTVELPENPLDIDFPSVD